MSWFVALLALMSGAASAQIVDFGDYSSFPSASSTRVTSLKIGTVTDAELIAVTNVTATGDDITGTDDEDGVTLPASLAQGAASSLTVNVTNTTGSTVYLNVWIDYNNNGVLTDSGEQIAANTTIATGTSNSNRTVSFTVPATATLGSVGVRVRLTSTSSPGPDGLDGNGEVEDHSLTITTAPTLGVGNLVWTDSNDNGRFDTGEGVSGVLVQLLNTSNTVVTSTTTDAAGLYQLTTTIPGTYYAKIPASEFASGKPLVGKYSRVGNGPDNGKDDEWDENGVDDAAPATNGIHSPNFTLTAGAEPTTGETGTDSSWDNGTAGRPSDANADLTIDFGFAICVQTNLITNGSFETANPTTLTFPDVFPTGGSAIAKTRTTASNADVANWSFDAGSYIQDPTHTTDGSRMVHLNSSGACAGQQFAVGSVISGLTQLAAGQVYTLSFDWAPFDPSAPNTPPAGNNTQIYTDFYYTNSGWTTSTFINSFADFYDTKTNDFLTNPRPLSTWASLDWRRCRYKFVLPPAPSGQNYLTLFLTAGGTTGKLLVDNVTLTVSCEQAVGSVGNLIFNDANGNRVKDATESGIDKALVHLYRRPATGSPVWVGSTYTSQGGRYLFSGMQPANYYVWVDSANFSATTPSWWQGGSIAGPLYNKLSSSSNANPNVTAAAASDDDVSEKGVDNAAPITNGIYSSDFALGVGTEPVSSVGGKETGAFNSLDDSVDSHGDMTIDFGFAPATAAADYGDYSLFPLASSTANSALRIGSVATDSETIPTTNDTATGDDTTGTDDEDGVTVPASMLQGASGTLTVNVTNSSGATAYLNVWIDFNDNGVLTDSGEQIAVNTTVATGTSNSNRTVNFTVPASAVPGKSGVRVRLTSTSSPGPDGLDGNGEVEDTTLFVGCIFPSNLTLGKLSSAYSQFATFSAPGMTAPITWSATGLPAGLVMDSAAARITGTPTGSAGAFPITVTAVDATSVSLTRSYTFFIEDSAVNLLTNGDFESGSAWTPTRLKLSSTTNNSMDVLTTGNPLTGMGSAMASNLLPDNSVFWLQTGTGKALTGNKYVLIRGNDNCVQLTDPALSGSSSVLVPGSSYKITAFVANTEATSGYLDFEMVDGSSSTVQTQKFTLPVPASNLSENAANCLELPWAEYGWTFTPPPAWNPANVVFYVSPQTIGSNVPGLVIDHWRVVRLTSLDFGDFSGFADASSSSLYKLRLGATVDAETAATTNATATGDDTNVSDDEDGVTMPASISLSSSVTIPVSVFNNTGSNAYLHAWIDFNNDGTLNDTLVTSGGERLETARAITTGTGVSTQNITFTVPASASSGTQRGVRFRLTNQAVTTPTGEVGSGEVEDYVVTIAATQDFGDYAPFPSASSTGNATLRIGATMDVEGSATTNATATGDDTTGSDDEDGVTIPASITQGTGTSMTVNVTNTSGTSAYLNVWIDFNGNGVLTDSGEQVATNTAVATATSNSNKTVSFTVPAEVKTGTVGVRARLTSISSPGPDGLDGNGEVEDVTTSIVANTDFGDYASFTSASSKSNGTLRLGALVDSEGSSVTNATATGDDLDGTDDEDGVTVPASIAQGAAGSLSLNLTNTTGSVGYLNAWIDFNRNGVLTDAGEQVAVNTNIATGTSNASLSINFTAPVAASLGTAGVRVRLTSVTTPGPDGLDGNGEVEDYATQIIAPTTDFGDELDFADASSTANNSLRLGALVDVEGSSTKNADATGDDTTTSDDEDGLTFPSVTAGQPVTLPVTVTNTTGAAGFLNVWIDYNNNGTLTDVGEQVATNVSVATATTNGTINLSFTIPTNAVTAATSLGSRFRITDIASPGPTGFAGVGEVEDHPVVILAPLTDFGDFSGAGDVSNTASTNLRLGALVDTEYASTRNAAATGDDTAGNDDEDGVTLPAMTAGAPATVPVTVTNSSGAAGYLNAWIDFNNNGVFTDANEQIANNINIANGTSNGVSNLAVIVPAAAVTGVNLGVRVRITALSSPGATGAGGVGEVEDYVISIAEPTTDFGDFTTFGSASSIRNNTLKLGALIDTEYAQTVNTTATGDDITGSDDEDAVTFPSMIAGAPATIPVLVTNTSGAAANLNLWIDYNGNGVLTDAGEQIATNVSIPNGSSNITQNVSITVPTTVLTGVNLGARLRLTSTTSPGAMGASGNGEVEDYIVVITAPTTDFGDFASFADASQGANPSLRLGATLDTEFVSTRNATATGDDTTGTDDEDGAVVPAMIAGQTITIPVTVTNNTGANGFLNTWIDFNNNGLLTDSGEQVATNTIVATGITNGVVNVSFTVPPAAVTGTAVGIRFRYSAPSGLGSTGANALAGEIEDYTVTIAAPTTDFGDFTGLGSASSTRNATLKLGALTDVEYAATTNATATGDDITGSDDEDAVTLPVLTVGAAASIPVIVTNTSGAAVFLNAWIDYNNNGVLTDAGEQIATNTSIANGSSGITQNISITVPAGAVSGASLGVRFRLTSTSTPGATGASGNGEVEDYVTTLQAASNDFGDFASFGSASNSANASLRLGALVDAEASATTNAAATGDDTTGSDDEDGVTLPAMTAGQTLTVPVVVTNSTGAAAFLNAWIDFNNNGVLTDAGDQVITNLSVATGSSNLTINPSINVSAAASTGVSLGVRFRLTTVSAPGATGALGSVGEVEDYLISIAAPTKDFGDFTGFGSASSTRNATLKLGALTDTEFAATTNATATGDDTTGSDDEDSVVIPAMTAGAPATLPVVVTNTSGAAAFLNVWIDYNNNGVLTEAGEQIATNLSIVTGSINLTQNLNITVPGTATQGVNLGVRLRLTSTSTPGATGAVGNGEVEDYVTSIATPLLDYGDISILGSAASNANGSLLLGALVDTEYTPVLNAIANGDDNTGSDDEDGVVLPVLTVGAPATIPVVVTNNSGAGAFLNAWIDFNNDGDVADAGEQLATDISVANGTTNGTVNLSFTVPFTAVSGANVALRFRLTNTGTPGITGTVGNGEVEDYVTTIAVPVTDFGDWNGAADASSIASSNLRMGPLADSEYASTRNAAASGDDATGSDDEDGVTLAAGYTLGAASSVTAVCTNLSGATGYLNAWVDWNNNGSFTDSGEQIATNMALTTGMNAVAQAVNFTVPAGAIPGQRGARFRFTSVQNPTSMGAAGTGEVEDYLLTVNCPTITVSPASLPNGTVAAAYSQTITAAGGSGSYTFDVSAGALPAGLTLSSAGLLSGTPTSGSAASFTIRATDVNGCSGIRAYTLSPVCTAISITPATAAAGVVGTAYSQTLSASGGTAPHGSWTVISGTLPTGLTLNASTGVISGTPTASASPATSVTVRVTDTYGCQGTQAVSIHICPVITVSPVTPIPGNAGIAYSQAVTGSGGTAPYVYALTSGTLPAGLTLNTSTGVVSGTPTVEISSTVTIRATDANGCAGTRSMTFAMTCPPIAINPSPLPTGLIGSAYSQTLTGSGGTAPYGSWTVASGTLPAGLTLSATTGIISGTPTASNGAGTTFTVSVRDAYNCLGTRSYTLVICPVITVNPATLSNGLVGGPYTQTVSASGGTGAYAFTVSSGALPAGLTLNSSNGIISGTPTSNTAASFIIRAADANGCSGTRAYTVTPALPTTDFGDFTSFPSASSTVAASLRMGAAADVEAVAKTDAAATGDDLDATDDEDGATIPASLTQGAASTFSVTVTNTTGAAAYLNVWVDFNGNGSITDAGEQILTNSSIATGLTNSVQTINFSTPVAASLGQAGVRLRLTSISNPGVDGQDGNGEVEDYITAIVVPTNDFGDDVDFADAFSIANTSLRLGALVDVEGAATKNAGSTGDDSTGSDDEDGTSFPSVTAGQPVVLPVIVTNNTGTAAFLNAWIDYNNNGVLTDAGEHVATNINVANGQSNSTLNLNFTIPTNAVTAASSVGARFRITSTATPDATGFAGTGEVEDHQVVILAPLTDFGDHSGYADVSNTANTNVRLGVLVDTEYASTRDATASGDDISGNDDEDGVTLPTMTAGAPTTIPVMVTNTSGIAAYLNVWIDYNNNGIFTDAGEQIATNTSISNGTSNGISNIVITVPAAASTGVNTGLRLRISNDISPGVSGSGGIGEVEDHIVNIAAPTTDFGDLSVFGSASSTRNAALKMGALIDTEFAATANAGATGDDSTGSDDEDAVTLPALVAGGPATIPVVVTNTSGSAAFLSAWIDFNNNGVLTDAGEQVATDVSIATGSSNLTQNLSITVPATTLTGVNLGARFRLVSTSGVAPTGAAGNGEVEDYVVNITAPVTDFGDFSGFADASQGANPVLRMGSLLDTEFASSKNATATGDDTTGSDDEDGVVLPAMTAGQTVTIPVTITNTTGANGYINAWIDYNNNGVLTDSGEQVATNVLVATGASNVVSNLTVNVPATAVTGVSLGVRFRFSAPSGLGPTGANALAGEIEDYVLTIAAPTTDFGDFSSLGSASSTANALIKLGALTDTEFTATTNATATGDDITGSDDEDAVSFPIMTVGAAVTIPVVVTNTSGAAVFLNAWIDYNNNGVLTDSGEQIATNISIANGSSSITQNLSITIPAGATVGTNLGARFRLTSGSTPGATGASGNGEVEDYTVNIASPTTDFGDFSGFADASNSANSTLRMGTLVDSEFAATTNATATGDDITGSDDENGVTLPAMTAGQTYTVPVVVTNTTGAGAFLNAWIDLNNDGDLLDAGEQFMNNVAIATGSNGITSNGSLTIPLTAVTGVNVGLRFRLTTTSSPGATGVLGSIGEIEDYVLNITSPPTDFGDFAGFGSASSVVVSTVKLGTLTDLEAAAITNATATGDDITGSDDEEAVTLPALMAGAPATIPVRVTNTSGVAVFLNAWIDFNNNNVLTDAGEQIATNISIATGSNNITQNLSVTVPAAALTGVNLGARFRLTSTSTPGATGVSGNGEVEDYVVNIAAPTLDYGDSSVLGSVASSANGNLRLGALVDTEYTPNMNTTASGDDTTGSDDEDGVTLPTMTAGAPAVIPVVVTNNTGAAAFLNAWIDFNNDGDVADVGEQLATNTSVVTGTSNSTINLSFTVPAAASTGTTVPLRFRLTSTSSPGITGTVGVGEVEDYITTIAVPATDFGDWNGAADASSIASSNLRMGSLADTEYVSTLNGAASGDDATGSDDEDGVTLAAGYNLGAASTMTVVVTNLTGSAGYLNVWVDWNNNGSFTDAGEQIATNTSLATGMNAVAQTVNFTVPAGAIPGLRGVRARLTNVQNPTSLGAAGIGEVEDYLLTVNCPTTTISPTTLPGGTVTVAYSQTLTASGGSGSYTFSVSAGALPAGLTLSSAGLLSGTPTSGTTASFTIRAADVNGCTGTRAYTFTPAPNADFGDLSTFGSASSTKDTTLKMGALVDYEYVQTTNATATGDDVTGSDDEDGVTLPAGLILGQSGLSVTVNVTNTSGAETYLNGWIDFNNNGVLTDAGEQIIFNEPIATGASGASMTYTFNVPSNAAIATVGARFRMTSIAAPGSTGASGAGEVEDYTLPITDSSDHGDFSLFQDASSMLSANLKMGDFTDSEAAAFTNLAATGDDLNNVNDEDGATVQAILVRGQAGVTVTVNVTNLTGSPAYLNGWADFNNNGALTDTDEQIITNVTVPTGTSSDYQTFFFDVPSTAALSAIGTRFRLTSVSAPGPIGASGNGEVEDYTTTIVAPSSNFRDYFYAIRSTNGTWYLDEISVYNPNSATPTVSVIPGILNLNTATSGFNASASNAYMNGLALDWLNRRFYWNSTSSGSSGYNFQLNTANYDNVTKTWSYQTVTGSNLSNVPFNTGTPNSSSSGSGAFPRAAYYAGDYYGGGQNNDNMVAWRLDTTGKALKTPAFNDYPNFFHLTQTFGGGDFVIRPQDGLLVTSTAVNNTTNTLFNQFMADGFNPTGPAATSVNINTQIPQASNSAVQIAGVGGVTRMYAVSASSAALNRLDNYDTSSPVAVRVGTLPTGSGVKYDDLSEGISSSVTSLGVKGIVYEDTNGLTNNTVDGTGSNVGGTLFAMLVDAAGNLVDSFPVKDDGTFILGGASVNTTYTVVLSTSSGSLGSTAPAADLPQGWMNTGEFLGSGAGSDGTVNGRLSVSVASNGLVNAKFGISQAVSVGNLVWNDANNNGLKDVSESGISGVTVQLWTPGTDNAIGGTGLAADTLITTTTSSGSGVYGFTNQLPGKYYVSVTPPAPYAFASSTVVTTDNGVDNDNNGSQPGGRGSQVYSPVIDLAVGKEPGNLASGGADIDNTIDFGLLPALDFGDNSLFGSAGSTVVSNVFIGSVIDAEYSETTNSTATGDNITGLNDEEGVTLPASVIQGGSGSMTVRVTNTSASTAYLNVWIDYNNNGSINAASDQIATNTAIAAGTSNANRIVNFTVPSTAFIGNVGVRVRLTSVNTPGSTGTSGTGEVEDHILTITSPADYGDFSGFASASSAAAPLLLRIGSLADSEPVGTTNATATGDDLTGSDDEDGVTVPASITLGSPDSLTVNVTNLGLTTAYLNAWIDFNRNGVLTDVGEQIATNTSISILTTGSNQTINFTTPATASLGAAGVRVRLTSTSSPTSVGLVGTGEVEDYVTQISCPTITLTPALPTAYLGTAYSQTLTAAGGTAPYSAWTVISGTLPAGFTLSSAGVLSGTSAVTSTTTVTVRATDANGCQGTQSLTLTVKGMTLGNRVWQDNDNDGTRDAGEPAVAGAQVILMNPGADNVIGGGSADVQVGALITTTSTGLYTFANLAPGNYYVRVLPPAGYTRTSGTPATLDNNVDDNNDGSQPGGAGTVLLSPVINLAPGAESVTDTDTDADTNLTVDFGLWAPLGVGNLVFIDFNNNGNYDDSEGIEGVYVQLFVQGANVTTDEPAGVAFTDHKGRYYIDNLNPGSYFLHLPASQFASGAPLAGMVPMSSVVAGDDDSGQNLLTAATPATTGASTADLTIFPGAQPTGAAESGFEGVTDDGLIDENNNLTLDLGLVSSSGGGFPLAMRERQTLIVTNGEATSPVTANTFTAWQSAHSTTEDHDLYPALLEYALDTDPDSGASGAGKFRLIVNETTGAADVLLTRPTTGREDISYNVEVSADAKTWTRLTTTTLTSIAADGSQIVRYPAIEDATVFAGQTRGFVRLKIVLDADLNGTPEDTAVTPVQAFSRELFSIGTRSFSMPLVKAELFAGEVSPGTGSTIILPVAVPLPEAQLYIQDLSSGVIYEVDELASTSTRIAIAAESLLAFESFPSSARIVLRTHHTLAELLPADLFTAGTSDADADRVMTFDAEANTFRVAWLSANGWTRDGTDASAESLPPQIALLVHARSADVSLLLVGQIAAAASLKPESSTRFISTGLTHSLSPVEAGLTVTKGFRAATSADAASRLRLWKADSEADATGYDSLFFLQTDDAAIWTRQDDDTKTDLSKESLLQPFHGFFLVP